MIICSTHATTRHFIPPPLLLIPQVSLHRLKRRIHPTHTLPMVQGYELVRMHQRWSLDKREWGKRRRVMVEWNWRQEVSRVGATENPSVRLPPFANLPPLSHCFL